MYFMKCLLQPRAIDSYITNDVYFPSRLELFQAILQEIQECFNVGCTNRRNQ